MRTSCPIIVMLCSAVAAAGEPAPSSVEVLPSAVELIGRRGSARLLVSGVFAGERRADLTRTARYRSSNPAVVTVSSEGWLAAKGDGTAEVTVEVGKLTARAAVRVRDVGSPDPVDFRTEVIAALSRGGCNQGACHGSPQGKNGFRLSLRGFEPELDRVTLTREVFGRRTNPSNPDSSLVITKATNQLPHVGGRRFRRDEPAFRVLRDWIAEGARDAGETSPPVRLEVLPGARTLHSSSPRQQLVVRVHFQDGTIRDVTHLAVFTSNDAESTGVSNDGLVEFGRTAETAVLVRYLKQLKSVRLSYVRSDPGYVAVERPEANYVDRHVFAKHRGLQLRAASAASDGVFLRRVSLDVLGVLPTPEEARAFIDSRDPQKVETTVDRLLARREFAEFWAMKWADVMQGNRQAVSERGVHSLHRYLVRHFDQDRSFARLAREMLTSVGNTIHNPPANFYRISRTPTAAAESMSQLFLGVRIQCARCHNHPYEAITQDDYFGLAAYFARVKLKGQRFGRDDEIVYLGRSGEVKHAAFGTAMGKHGPADDPRGRLADWLEAPGNPWFARSTVNRIWYHLFGLGLVEPVDDFRDSNPPTHPELLDALAADFARQGHRFKPLIRTIVMSQSYRLAAELVEQSAHAANPDRYITQARVQMLSAEQILDAISAATGVPEKFPGYPLGTRAVQLAEGNVDHNFLKAFARPVRDVRCDCARETEPTLNQVVHLINNKDILDRFDAPTSRLGLLLAAGAATEQIIEVLYLASLSRRPTAAERKLTREHVAGFTDRAEGLKDVQHALVNCNEFLLRH